MVQPLAPELSNALITKVFVPTSNGIALAVQRPVPAASPLLPAEVCQVIFLTPPLPPELTPDTVIEVEAVVTTMPAGDCTEIEIGEFVSVAAGM